MKNESEALIEQSWMCILFRHKRHMLSYSLFFLLPPCLCSLRCSVDVLFATLCFWLGFFCYVCAGLCFFPSPEMFIFHAGFSQETEFNHDVLCGRLTSFPRLQHAGAALASSLLLWSSAYIIVSASSYSQDCGIQEKMLNQTTSKAGNYQIVFGCKKSMNNFAFFFAVQQLTCGFGWLEKKRDPIHDQFLSSKQNGRFKKWEQSADGHKLLVRNFAGARGSTDGLNKVRPEVASLSGLVFFPVKFVYLCCLLFAFFSHILLAWSRRITIKALSGRFSFHRIPSPFLFRLLPCFPVYFSLFLFFFLTHMLLYPGFCFDFPTGRVSSSVT